MTPEQRAERCVMGGCITVNDDEPMESRKARLNSAICVRDAQRRGVVREIIEAVAAERQIWRHAIEDVRAKHTSQESNRTCSEIIEAAAIRARK